MLITLALALADTHTGRSQATANEQLNQTTGICSNGIYCSNARTEVTPDMEARERQAPQHKLWLKTRYLSE